MNIYEFFSKIFQGIENCIYINNIAKDQYTENYCLSKIRDFIYGLLFDDFIY